MRFEIDGSFLFITDILPVEERLQIEIQSHSKLIQEEKMSPLVRTKLLLTQISSSFQKTHRDDQLEESSSYQSSPLLKIFQTQNFIQNSLLVPRSTGNVGSSRNTSLMQHAPKIANHLDLNRFNEDQDRFTLEESQDTLELFQLEPRPTAFYEAYSEENNEVHLSQVVDYEEPQSQGLDIRHRENIPCHEPLNLSIESTKTVQEELYDRKKLEEAIDSDANLVLFKQQILDSGLTVRDLLETPSKELEEVMMDYLKMKQLSARIAVSALQRRLRLCLRTKQAPKYSK